SFSSSTLRLSLACLLGTLVLVGTGAGKPRSAVADTSDPVPLYDQWTPTTQVFQNPQDGAISATIGSGPIQAPDPSSLTGWSAIDTALQPTADGLAPEATTADVTFSDGTDQAAPLVSVSQNETSLSVVPCGDVPVPTVSGDTATYDQAMAGVDETLQAKAEGFEVN